MYLNLNRILNPLVHPSPVSLGAQFMFKDMPADVVEGKRRRMTWGKFGTTKVVVDYSRLSETEPYPVWYPSRTGVYEVEEKPKPKEFGAI